MTRKLVLAFLVLSRAAGGCAATSAVGQDVPAAAGAAALSSEEREARALERRWLDAYERNDMAAMTEIVADDFTITFPDANVDTKAEILDQMRAVPPGSPANRFHTRNTAARSYGDTVVLIGIVTVETVREGRPVRQEWAYTDTYVRRNGRWQVVASHLSSLPRRDYRP